MTLTKRSTKGSALTFDELDGNFTHLGHDGTYHNAGVRIGPPGTVLEMLAGHADGRTLVGHSGSYTLQNVTGAQELTSTFTSIGLDIDYIPPTGTKTVLYESQFQIRFKDADPLLHFKATWDGNELEPSRSTFRIRAANNNHQLIYNLSVAIEVNASSVDIPKARIGPWTAAKTLSWTGRDYSTSFDGSLHTTNNWDGTGDDIFICPMLKITAIA
jgi:hypothetical protein